jgi:hypothetical protein
MSEKQKPIPDPLYPCRFNDCLSTWPAELLFWSEPLQDWVCDQCWDDVDAHWTDDGRVDCGISLAQELRERNNRLEKKPRPHQRAVNRGRVE